MREETVEDRLVRLVKRHGGEVRKLVWLGRRHAPARLVMWPSRHDLIELKAPGKKARSGQTREHARLRSAGFNVEVLDTVEKVDNYIARMSLLL